MDGWVAGDGKSILCGIRISFFFLFPFFFLLVFCNECKRPFVLVLKWINTLKTLTVHRSYYLWVMVLIYEIIRAGA